MIAVRFNSSFDSSDNPEHCIAVINHYEWVSKSKNLQDILNGWIDPDGPGGEVPDPDLQAAQDAIERIGGKIIKHEPNPYPPRGATL